MQQTANGTRPPGCGVPPQTLQPGASVNVLWVPGAEPHMCQCEWRPAPQEKGTLEAPKGTSILSKCIYLFSQLYLFILFYSIFFFPLKGPWAINDRAVRLARLFSHQSLWFGPRDGALVHSSCFLFPIFLPFPAYISVHLKLSCPAM